MEKKNRNEKWQKGETLNTVIGQGLHYQLPLQITLMTARIASGKKLEPQIVKEIDFFEDLEVSEKNLNFIRKSMYKVVNEYEGTAIYRDLRIN